MENKFKLLDRFVRIIYLANILKMNDNKGVESFNSGSTSIDFSDLGLPSDIVSQLGKNPSLEKVKRIENEIDQLVSAYNSMIYGTMICDLSTEEKNEIKEYAEAKAAEYSELAIHYQENCLVLNDQLQEQLLHKTPLNRLEVSRTIRDLGRIITLNSNKAFEYTSYSESYLNIIGYIKGLLGPGFGDR